MKRSGCLITLATALIAASSLAHAEEVAPTEKESIETVAAGHPLTSVVITQCNLIVAVYITMPDGKLLRFDKTANVPAAKMISMAYTAVRSERVEVACDANATGVVGYEKHEPM